MVKTGRKNNERGSQKKGMHDIARPDKTHGKNRNTPKKYIPSILFIVIAELVEDIATADIQNQHHDSGK
jgi:hypothetical protein